jgi:hypothetical protein
MKQISGLLWAWLIPSLLVLIDRPLVVIAQSAPSSLQSASPTAKSTTIDFDRHPVGPVEQEFTPFLSGLGKPASWEVRADPSALSGKNVLAQTSYEQIDYRFPLLVYNDVIAKDVYVAVQFKPISGKIDQAAGVIVRFQNPDNFYAVRANALEDTVQLYRVVNGVRQVISGDTARVESDQWHSLEVTAKGTHLSIAFDGRALFDIDDETITKAGKIGLSTKSDGVTVFDDLQITVLD